MMLWSIQPGADPAVLGYLPAFLDDEDHRPAVEQIAENYSGGWDSFKGFEVGDNQTLLYPGDPPLKPVAFTKLRDEVIILYEYSFLRIVQPDGTFDVARVD